jgi:hypothetical protein
VTQTWISAAISKCSAAKCASFCPPSTTCIAFTQSKCAAIAAHLLRCRATRSVAQTDLFRCPTAQVQFPWFPRIRCPTRSVCSWSCESPCRLLNKKFLLSAVARSLISAALQRVNSEDHHRITLRLRFLRIAGTKIGDNIAKSL